MAEQVIRAFKAQGLPVVDTEAELIARQRAVAGDKRGINWTGPLTSDTIDALVQVLAVADPPAGAILVTEVAEYGGGRVEVVV